MKILILITATAFSLSAAIFMPASAENATGRLKAGAVSNQTSFEVMNFKPSYGAPKRDRPATVDQANHKRPMTKLWVWNTDPVSKDVSR